MVIGLTVYAQQQFYNFKVGTFTYFLLQYGYICNHHESGGMFRIRLVYPTQNVKKLQMGVAIV